MLFRHIGKVHLIKTNRTAEAFGCKRRCPVRNLFRFFNELKKPRRAGNGILEFR